MKCDQCPVAPPTDCRGETHRVFCGYIDPSSPTYTPAYAEILVADKVLVTASDRALMAAKANFEIDFVAVSGCCCG